MSRFERQVSAREGRTLLGLENVNPFLPNYYNFEIKGLSAKDVGIETTYFY